MQMVATAPDTRYQLQQGCRRLQGGVQGQRRPATAGTPSTAGSQATEVTPGAPAVVSTTAAETKVSKAARTPESVQQ
jgi:hypothetical protein